MGNNLIRECSGLSRPPYLWQRHGEVEGTNAISTPPSGFDAYSGGKNLIVQVEEGVQCCVTQNASSPSLLIASLSLVLIPFLHSFPFCRFEQPDHVRPPRSERTPRAVKKASALPTAQDSVRPSRAERQIFFALEQERSVAMGPREQGLAPCCHSIHLGRSINTH